ncbi:MAG: Methenyltetrahydrofolate cyclohydrolase [bacterium ADurb.Bin270]|nr:MAG: Methenyltetrahydrofolate cyclohydrolase [bacterium ADurb.Bin270]HQC50718.1 glutamate formimidoyltransferase [bacterium]HQG13707.1 glutamate formimidoyltransferase [bacterium]
MKLVECVPNFSEGRDAAVIEAISDAIKSISGVALLDVDPGKATNRTVYTFAGAPDDVVEAAFQAIKKGTSLIDMRKHKGEHARQGACDVCPFVPISDVTMAECVALSNRLAKRVGDELGIPVYLYAEAAKVPERKRLPDIRSGEYEALEEKLKKPEWKPDFGPAKFNPSAGATVIGARNFLIAYNINLNTKNVKLAKDIAFEIRESGKLKRDENGNKILGPDGVALREPGIFKNLQGTGWIIPEYGRAQITLNILDTETTPVHLVYDKCCELAEKLGCRVTGSEVVGMIPRKVLRDAGIYFLKKQGSTTGISDDGIIHNGIISLGLSDIAPFDSKQKIIEERFVNEKPLLSMTLEAFAKELSSNSPAPGGGSIAALAGAMSAGLTSMVAALSFEKKGLEALKPEMEEIGCEAQKIMNSQLSSIDDDTSAFNAIMDAMRMPKESDEQKSLRKAAITEATKRATLEPFRVLERSVPSLELAARVAKKGNQSSLSDAGVAALMAHSAAIGAYYNVLINLSGIDDKKWCDDVKSRATDLLKKADDLASKIREGMMDKL